MYRTQYCTSFLFIVPKWRRCAELRVPSSRSSVGTVLSARSTLMPRLVQSRKHRISNQERQSPPTRRAPNRTLPKRHHRELPTRKRPRKARRFRLARAPHKTHHQARTEAWILMGSISRRISPTASLRSLARRKIKVRSLEVRLPSEYQNLRIQCEIDARVETQWRISQSESRAT